MSDIMLRASEIIQAARDFVRTRQQFAPEAPTLVAELDSLLKALRGYDDPESDTFLPGLPQLADELAAVIHYSNMPSDDAVIIFWRGGL